MAIVNASLHSSPRQFVGHPGFNFVERQGMVDGAKIDPLKDVVEIIAVGVFEYPIAMPLPLSAQAII
jgi:hypothetical protein